MADRRFYAALIYVTDTEQRAVLNLYNWAQTTFLDDDQVYYEAEIMVKGQQMLIVAAKQDDMGMTASATLTLKLIDHYHPYYIIMPGIAAGINVHTKPMEQEYGDVLLADKVWNASNGKYVSPSKAEIVFGEIGFQPRPTKILMNSKLINLIKAELNSVENQTYVHVGALASGSAVMSNRAMISKQIIPTMGQTVGLEMESFGVAYAAKHAIGVKPEVIIAKSICDFGDEQKDDRYQKFAAYTSCEFVDFLIRNVLYKFISEEE